MEKITSHSALETKDLASNLAIQILSEKNLKHAIILGLKGDLGAGKTTFLQGFALGLGIKEKILSPTFVLMKRFKLNEKNFKNFYHIDCYRLKNEEDLEMLGFKKLIEDPQNIIAVEWPERIEKIMPDEFIEIQLSHSKEGQRTIAINNKQL